MDSPTGDKPGVVVLDPHETKLLLALVLENLERAEWKSTMLDNIAHEFAFSLFGENGRYIEGGDVPYLRVEALAVWQERQNR